MPSRNALPAAQTAATVSSATPATATATCMAPGWPMNTRMNITIGAVIGSSERVTANGPSGRTSTVTVNAKVAICVADTGHISCA